MIVSGSCPTGGPDHQSRWLIGHELRRTRLYARRTQADAAKTLDCTPVKINHLEIGPNQQQPDEVTALMRLYGADVADVDRLASLAVRADQGTWWAPFSDVLPKLRRSSR